MSGRLLKDGEPALRLLYLAKTQTIITSMGFQSKFGYYHKTGMIFDDSTRGYNHRGNLQTCNCPKTLQGITKNQYIKIKP